MDIDTLTVGQLREISKMLPGLVAAEAKQAQAPHPFVGKYVICRCYSAGVHTGELVSFTGDQAILRNSRRLWSWKARDGVALSGVAQNGLASGCKVDTENPEIALTGVIEVIPCSQAAKESIRDYNVR